MKPEDHLKIYYDKSLTKEIENDILDLGTINAGETKEYIFYIKNDGWGEFYNLNFVLINEEIKIIEFPNQLFPNAIGELKLEWKSTVSIEKPKKTKIKIEGQALYPYLI